MEASIEKQIKQDYFNKRESDIRNRWETKLDRLNRVEEDLSKWLNDNHPEAELTDYQKSIVIKYCTENKDVINLI